MEIKDTLAAREGQYGQYKVVGQISQDIKAVMRQSPNYYNMPQYARESLDMIAIRWLGFSMETIFLMIHGMT